MYYTIIIVSNKLCVICDILKSNKIARDSGHFEGKSSFGKSGKTGVIFFIPSLSSSEGVFL